MLGTPQLHLNREKIDDKRRGVPGLFLFGDMMTQTETELTNEEKLIVLKGLLSTRIQMASLLKTKIAKQEAELATDQEQLTELIGTGFGWRSHPGNIADTKSNIVQLERIIADSSKPFVVLTDGKTLDYIVNKVTAKRIFVRGAGWHRPGDAYNHDGTTVGGRYKGTPIDIEATFGGPLPTPKEWKAKYGS
jgi:hypothetical protein